MSQTQLITDRHVLVVGGGEVGVSRIRLLLQANAKITVISPKVDNEITFYQSKGLLHNVIRKHFEPHDLKMYETDVLLEEDVIDMEKVEDIEKNQRFALVLSCIDDHETSKRIYYHCKRHNLCVNIADKPPICDFYFGSMFRKGSLQIMISSNGKSPRLTNKLKTQKIEPLFEKIDVDKSVDNLGRLRHKLRNEYCVGEDPVTIKKRMEWNKAVTDIFTVEEWSTMNHEMVDQLLDYYPELPTTEELSAMFSQKMTI